MGASARIYYQMDLTNSQWKLIEPLSPQSQERIATWGTPDPRSAGDRQCAAVCGQDRLSVALVAAGVRPLGNGLRVLQSLEPHDGLAGHP
jgi:hypothetical protein